MTPDLSALWDDTASDEDRIATYQYLIDTGQAWRLEGSVGRTAMDLIEAGHCMLGEESHRDYWGNTVPSRYDVAPGSKGSPEFVEKHT